MHKNCNITVIGTGVLSLSIAGQMAANGGKVTFIDTKASQDVLNRLNNAKKLVFTGAINFESLIENFISDYDSVANADVIAVTVSASVFPEVFDKILPRIKDGQRIIFFPGSFGAILFKNRLESETLVKNISISEVVSFPFVTNLKDFNTIHVHSIKNKLKIASCPQKKNLELCNFYNTFFNIFTCGQSFLETSLENINSVLHPLPILLNVGHTEKDSKSFKHFIDGITPLIGNLVERMDAERLAVGKVYGLKLSSSLEQLMSYYGQNEAQNLYEYVAGKDSPYNDVSGYGLDSRYITEDIPFLVVPSESLGKAANVKMPIFELVINLARLLLNEDFSTEGFTIKRLGLEGMSVESIQQVLRKFQ